LWRWRKEWREAGIYSDLLYSHAIRELGEKVPEALAALCREAAGGNLGAIDRQLELAGRREDKQKVEQSGQIAIEFVTQLDDDDTSSDD
jgi:hypothetical protein